MEPKEPRRALTGVGAASMTQLGGTSVKRRTLDSTRGNTSMMSRVGSLTGVLAPIGSLLHVSHTDLDEYVQAAQRAEGRSLASMDSRRLLPDGEQDPDSIDAANFRKHLQALVQKYKPDVATITLRYQNLTVETDALVGTAAVPTVGDSFKYLLWSLVGKKRPTINQRVLQNIHGVIEPARLTLLLGPPASGKSALLKVLAGRYNRSNNLRVSGDITYNGHHFDEFCVNRTAAYINQVDNHMPQLTVLDTLKFAYECQNGNNNTDFNLFAELRQAIQKARGASAAGPTAPMPGGDGISDLEEQILSLGEQLYNSDVKVTNMMRAFGILNAQHKPIGSELRRGVSGGERKRVTLAEMMLGPRRIMFMDEISTGLDSATLYSIMTHLRDYVHTFQVTCLVSLLQPPPEVYNLFDDLCLMSQGQVVYHGPISDALDYFTSLGFVCPPRKDVPSFLQEITTPTGQHEFAGPQLLQQRGIVPGTTDNRYFVIPVEEMVQCFWDSQPGHVMKKKLDVPVDPTTSHPAALAKAPYALSLGQAFRVALHLHRKLTAQSTALHVVRLLRTIIIALLVGGLFFQPDVSIIGARALIGAMFLSVTMTTMGSLLQLPGALDSKRIWFKWRDSNFLSAWAYIPAYALSQVPMTMLDTLVWCTITYLMWGLPRSLSVFGIYWLVLMSTGLCLNSLFRGTAYVFPNGFVAVTYGGVIWALWYIMSGFAIVRSDIPPWWIWAFYSSPVSWSMRAICINVFTSPAWEAPVPGAPDTTIGEEALALFDLFTDTIWIWYGVAFLLGSALALDLVTILAAQYLTPGVTSHVPDEEAVAAARRKAAEVSDGHAASAGQLQEPLKASDWVSVRVSSVPPHASEDQLHELGHLSFTPITLVFQNLSYSIPNPAYKKGAVSDQGAPIPERLQLLEAITGFAEPGVLTALMGGTGAGKTTLMNCIAGRTTLGVVGGQLTVNGHPKDQHTWSRVVGYCEQVDVHTPAQTVKEALTFSARMRLPYRLTRSQIDAFVEEVMTVLELTPIQFSLVGHLGNGLSVEQRKRLTIGVELVANPSVVFMDEPTSGLDARAAAIVMRVVKNISRSGRTIMVTIHQPSIEIFEAFDQLLLLQLGGRITYFGALGAQSCHLVEYLQRVPGCPPLATGHNPAMYMLEVTGGAVAVLTQTVEADWPGLYQASELVRANEERAAQLVSQLSASDPLIVEGGRWATPVPHQFKVLAGKYFTAYWRNPDYNFTRFQVTILQALAFGTIWYKRGDLPIPTEPMQIQTYMGIINTCATALGTASLLSIIPILDTERQVFYREKAASMYSPWAFSLTVTAVESPYLICQVLLFIGIIYPLVHLKQSLVQFLWYLLLSWQAMSYYLSLGMMLVFITPGSLLATLIGSSLNVLFSLFDGFVLPPPSMPKALRWINRIVPTAWTLHGLAGDQLLPCENPLLSPAQPSLKTVGDFVASVYGYDFRLHWFTPLILFAFIAFARVGAVLGLRYLSFVRR